DRERARPRRRPPGRPRAGPRRHHPGEPLRSRRQGRGDRREVLRHPGGPVVSVAPAFEKARADGRGVLVGYLPAGFPSVDGAISAIRAMVAAGVDLVEVGMPYSDPVLDGPVIQRASDAALRAGVRTADIFRTVAAVADTGVPVVVMTYWNPVERYGVDAFSRDLASAGGAGLITPDLIPDEA